MKFSNFVSTLAMVCLAYNVDAVSIQSESEVAHDVCNRHYAKCKGTIDVL